MDSEAREQTLELEQRIEELAEAIASCRRIIAVSKFAMAAGALLMLAMVLGALQFEPAAMIAAMAALIGGMVLFGSNSSTADRAAAALKVAQADRAALIGLIDLRLVGGQDHGTIERLPH